MTKTLQLHDIFMKRCLELASNGFGHVAPNPMVGAIVVLDNNIVGEGYHVLFGQPHAEVNAIQNVSDCGLLSKSTLYVNLEPCTHLGKTPPCSDLIISSGIKKVVIGTKDPNPLVSGKGIKRLRENGIDVVENVLYEECYNLNRRFFTFFEKKRPYIILKWAQTKDKFIDLNRQPGEAVGINWISNPLSRTLVHRWRAEEQAIMVGTNTILVDNPQLNVRHWKGKNPLRVILDRTLRIPASAKVLENGSPTIVFTEGKKENTKQAEYCQINFDEAMFNAIFYELYNRQIQSIIVEGGRELIESFLKKNLWDEARVIEGNKYFENGYAAPVISAKEESVDDILNDRLFLYRNHFKS